MWQFSNQAVNFDERLQKFRKVVEVVLTGGVTQCVRRVGVCFNEQSVDTCGDPGASQHIQVLACTTARILARYAVFSDRKSVV